MVSKKERRKNQETLRRLEERLTERNTPSDPEREEYTKPTKQDTTECEALVERVPNEDTTLETLTKRQKQAIIRNKIEELKRSNLSRESHDVTQARINQTTELLERYGISPNSKFYEMAQKVISNLNAKIGFPEEPSQPKTLRKKNMLGYLITLESL